VDVSLVEIKQAEQRIRDFIYFSPCQLSAALSEVTGQQVFLKLDNLQRTGAFKERGALNRILLLSEDEKRPPAPAIMLRPWPTMPPSAVCWRGLSCRS
jgi:threonine dehydratase